MGCIMGIVKHKREKLTPKENRAQYSFLLEMEIKKRKTGNPVIVGMVGLVGSGKSAVAKEIAKHIGGTVVEGDKIRVELRKQGEKFEGARKIAENAVREIIQLGGNAVLDSDFSDIRKRASIREKARKFGARLVFVRTYSDHDLMMARILLGRYHNHPDDFFGSASTSLRPQNEQLIGEVIKLREMWRRTPWHYRWVSRGGGQWVLRKLPFAVFAKIDTADVDEWEKTVEKYCRKILSL